MELMYNELSATPFSDNKALANLKVTKFINCYKEAKLKGFEKVRFSTHFYEIELTSGYTLQNWLEETTQRNFKDLLLGARTFPFIKPEDSWAEDSYLRNLYFYESIENKISKTECLGLAAAHIYDTLAISFSGIAVWEANNISLTKVDADKQINEKIIITNVHSNKCFEVNIIKVFIERISEVVLIESQLNPKDKPIHFRQDHGTDDLTAFAKRIRNSQYVNGIINSLPWNNRTTNFIRRVYPNGMIEVVLYWTEEGLGMVIQTTGRNFKETQRIAELLETEYS